MRKALLLLVLGLLAGSAGASSIDAVIQQDCPVDYEPVISMSNPDKGYSNPAPPGFYSYDLCVQGVEEAKIADSCSRNTGFYLSENSTDNAHFSMFSSYKVPVCTSRMVTQVRDSCLDNQTALMSVSGETNAHVASPGFFDDQLCGFFASPENITVEMEFNLTSSDQVYADDQEIGEQELRLAEFPYVVSEGGGVTAGMVAPGMIRVERELDTRNRLVMERSEGTFLVPFTKGDHDNIEDDQEEILNGRFLSQLDASFSYFKPEEATVRTILASNVTVESGIELSQGTHMLEIIKTGENTVRIERR